MSLFHPVEWNNFLRVSATRPSEWPRCALELTVLIGRRITGQVQQRRTAGTHRGAKIRPQWLAASPLAVAVSPGPWCLPEYPAATDSHMFPPIVDVGDADDVETYFSQHRWRECISALGDDAAGRRRVIERELAWIDQPLPKSDRAWEPYSASERVVNLSVLLAARPQTLSGGEVAAITRFLSESLIWIDSRLEYYGPTRTNNHILNNARALVVGGTLLRSVDAVERGLVVFAHMVPVLFGPDGWLRERSSHYQVIITQWLLDAVHFGRQSEASATERGRQVLDDLKTQATRASHATVWLLDALGGVPTYVGDISPDMPPTWSVARLHTLYPHVLTAVDRRSTRDDWACVSAFGHTLVACLGPSRHPEPYPTHGHQDLGGFVWLVGGAPALVDAGRSWYIDNPTAQKQIGPEGHNTLTLNGLAPLADSVLRVGRWYPEPYCRATVQREVLEDGFLLTHDGFRRLRGLGLHVRTVTVARERLTVEDRLEGTGHVCVEQFWHFAPGATRPSGGASVVSGGVELTLESVSSGGESPEIDWQPYACAVAYGQNEAALMAKLTWSICLPCAIRTEFTVKPCAA